MGHCDIEIHGLLLKWQANPLIILQVDGKIQTITSGTNCYSVRYRTLQNVNFIGWKKSTAGSSAGCWNSRNVPQVDGNCGHQRLTGLCICLIWDCLWCAALSSLTRFSSCCSESYIWLLRDWLIKWERIVIGRLPWALWQGSLAAAQNSCIWLLHDWLIISELAYDWLALPWVLWQKLLLWMLHVVVMWLANNMQTGIWLAGAALSSLTRFSSCCSESYIYLAVTWLANNIRTVIWLAGAALSSLTRFSSCCSDSCIWLRNSFRPVISSVLDIFRSSTYSTKNNDS